MLKNYEFVDFTVRFVPSVGYLPMLVNENGKELYRGEFKRTAKDALEAALKMFAQLNEREAFKATMAELFANTNTSEA